MRMRYGRPGVSGQVGQTRRFGPTLSLFGLILALSQPSSSSGQDPAPRITIVGTAQATLAEGPDVNGRSNSVSVLCYAPDGSSLAVGMARSNLVLLVDPATLKVRDRFPGHSALVSRVVFSPDGKTLISSGYDGTVRFWDLSTKRQRLQLDEFSEARIRGLAISPDGRQIVTGEMRIHNPATVQAWDATDGRLLGSLADYDSGVECLAISPDGLTLATTSRHEQAIRLWDLATFKQKNLFDAKESYTYQIAYLPDGKSLAAVFKDQSLRMVDVATMSQKYQIEIKANPFCCLAISPDGSILATADINPTAETSRLQLWRSSDGSPITSVSETGGRLAALAFSPDGRSVVVGGESGFIRIFRLERDSK